MVGKDGVTKPPRTKSYGKEKLYSIIKIKKKPPPPPKVGGDRRNNEPEYEEVGPPTALKKNQDKRGDGQHCDLCGSSEAAVRCDRCGSQAFCLSCDDMYHRHPRRSSHLRKAVDSLNSVGGGVRPPLPPKGEGQGAPPPQPPPRKNKRSGFLSNTGFNKKEQNYQYSTGSGHGSYRSASLTNLQNGPNNSDGGSRYSLALPVRKPTSASSEAGGSAGRTIMGSLKRFMGARPLPPTPDQAKSALKNERPSSSAQKILTRANTSPSLPNLSEPLSNEDIRAGLPQSVLDINRTRLPNNSTSTPVTPASAHAQYPPLQPKTQPSNAHTQSLGRKFSLQQLPQTFDDKRTSMVEGTPGSVPWDAEAPKPAARTRSQSVSDDQWAQMMAAQVSGGNTDLSVLTCPPGHTPTDMSAFAGATTRRSFNTMGGGARSASSFGRGMVSSASVCDLNTLAQQQTQHGFNNSHGANSFQQLNMMGYNNGMMWGAPCDLCQGAGMYPGHPSASGMKRTASNLSMNLSSVGSDASGYPWGPPPPHMHHHMPPMYLGYYPGYHPHMGPPPMGSGMGLNMSIPDSMHTFGKVPSSPAPSLRSSSHRSHKSSKSRSFSAADTSGRSSRARKLKRSEESEESRSSSVSEDDDLDDRESKSGHHSSSIAWQCDHCTFINSGGARTCGMCSKTVGSSGRSSSRRGSERRRSERRRDRRTDHDDDERDVSDYDNDGVVKSNLSFNIKDSKRDTRTKVSGSSKSKSKKKSRRRGSSASDSESGSEGGEDERLERHMRDLRLSSSSSRRRGSDYEGINHKDKDRERERSSRKKEGSSGRFKNWGRSHSERSRTPGRQTPRHASPVDDLESGELSPESSPQDNGQGQVLNTNENEPNGSPGETIVEPDNSEATMKNEGKSRSGSRDRRNEIKKERAPTPPPSPVEENVQETNPENVLIPEVVNGNKSRSCSPRLEVPKGRSPAHSVRNSKGDADEPSFANTLDDITTIGTNEVADQDFSQYIDEHLHSSHEHPQLEEPQDDVPVLEYIRPKTPEEEVVEEVKTIADVPAPIPTVNGHVDAKENEIVSKDTGQPVQKPEVIPYSVYEPRYEPIEEPAQLEIPPAGESSQARIQTQAHGQGTQEEAEENNEMGTLERFLKAHEGKQGSPLILRTIDVARASSGSSLGHSSPPDRDRQYTPLSCSSSDAQFYSPPDSPDLSLSEQLKDVPATSQTQALTLNQDGRPTNNSQTLRSREDESYLVTALESILTTAKAAEDVKSSRETIRSSMEQLPYSEEAFEGENAKEPPPRPASVGAAPPLDNYESLSFQDALTPSGAAKLARSSSAKDLLLSSAVVYDSTTKEMSSGILSLQQEADRQARAAAWSKEDLSEKYMTVEEIITKRRQKVMETQGLQLVQVLRDAEEAGYSSEEVSIALTHCGDKSPLEWLKENWKHMIDTVLTLATNYGHERRVNDIGSISAHEACIALRIHKGNIWAAVTECVEQRQKKFNEIYSRGKFKRADVVKALEKHDGDVDAAFLEVNKSQLQPFMMKIWGSGSSSPSQAKGTQPPAPAVSSSVSNEVSSSPAPSRSTAQEVVTTQSTQTDKDTEDDQGKQSPERHLLDEPGMAQTRTGPVTVQKASAIVGKAIAKAMARETSARESLSRSVTPEGQENTLTTPEPSEGEEDTTGQVTVSDSDDEDHLRTLDTIPEEEEMSERTESRVSRSASRNLFLPFNPTDVIQLSPVAKALGKLTGTKTGTAKAKSKESPSSTTDSVPGTPHGYYNATQQNTYYNESGVKNYYNEATGKNYYNEAGAKIEGVTSDKHPPDDYESMAEVKEKSEASAQEREMTTDATVAATPDVKEGDDDDDDEEEVIYYEEVILKTDEKVSDENKSGPSGTRRRRRRRRKSRSHGGGTAGTSSRADIVESPAGDDFPPTTSAATPSPTPAAVPEPSKERSPSADYSTVSKTAGKTSRLSDNKSYSIIEVVKTTESTSKSVGTSSSGESEEEGPEKAEMIEGLKARHSKEPDYQEVRELKEQIQMMRKQLEARMEEDSEARPDTPETPQDEQPPKGPLLVLQGSPTNERPPSREYEQLKFDRTVRRLLAEGQAGSYEKAELAAQLMSFNFDEYDSLQAAEECSSIYTAIQFLQQECELCAEKYPMGKMVSMLQCTHRCCRECAKTYFTFQIKTKNIRDLRCPFCNEPDLDACEEIANEYLNNMDILLKNIIDEETHELFQRKLRDWTLMKDPNFRWCNKCSSGFIANPRARKLICPDCKDVTCAHCRATWEPAHEGISCEAFAQWKVDNDLEVQAQGVAKHLAENGITCPKCKFTYSLAKGGCMHFTCTQCKYEFCSGCGQPFRQGSKCPIGPYCERLGLHAHHPRNCLFYLRDKEPHQLQNLLKDAGISYDTEAPQVRDSHGQKVLCLVQEQKELPDGLKDDICGRIVPDGYAGLCKTHYIEYLARLVFKFNLDPLPLMDEDELRFILRRDNLQAPKRRDEETMRGFLERINELIKEHLPLDSNEQ
ncbi:E3 ubiquitin-protein ligase lubel-like isoform X47 [Macrobrachium rosenbergii]|uniref:E3 ubiquitin-protein ligase lubel-like isoform X47 n=1 Tax=Macrobrachium rosenbergii TaxID=79674 RepID=UPI0034D77D8D